MWHKQTQPVEYSRGLIDILWRWRISWKGTDPNAAGGRVCLWANSQALGKLIWAEWNTNTLFIEIRPINKQSSRFKEPSAGLAIEVFCSPLSSSLPTVLFSEKQSWYKGASCGSGKEWKPEICLQAIKHLKVFVMTVVPWGAKAFPLSFSKFLLIPGFSFFHPCHKLFHTHCQAGCSCSDRDTLAPLGFCSAPLYCVFIPLKSQAPQDASTPPQCILMRFLQLGLLPRYSLHLLAKPFGVLTKCLPRLLLRNVHMHMRVMNNASLHALGLVCKWGWMLGWVQMKNSFEKQHRLAKWI